MSDVTSKPIGMVNSSGSNGLPDNPKNHLEVRLAELNTRKLESELDQAEKSEAWKRAQPIALALIPTATTAILRFGKALAQLHLGTLFWVRSYRTTGANPGVSKTREQLQAKYSEMFEAYTEALYYLGEVTIGQIEYYDHLLGEAFAAIESSGTSEEVIGKITENLVDSFRRIRYQLRYRLDPLETLREAAGLLSLTSRAEADRKLRATIARQERKNKKKRKE